MSASESRALPEPLSHRQALVLRSVVAAYVAEAQPVASALLARLIPVSLSAASIRNTLAELQEMGLVDKPHHSAGRIPTERGLRVFVDHLMQRHRLGRYERAGIADRLEDARAGLVDLASRVLSDETRQAGFVARTGVERMTLRHLSLVRVSRERVLALLVSGLGETHRCVIEEPGSDDQAELDRLAALLNERVAGRSLGEIRALLAAEAGSLRSAASRLLGRALLLGAAAVEEVVGQRSEVVVATGRELFDQPEFRDPERVRQLLDAIETKERLLAVVDRVLENGSGVRVVFGEELGDPALRQLAFVAAPFGSGTPPLGLVGVLGPQRMDYPRVVPLVEYLSRVVTERVDA